MNIRAAGLPRRDFQGFRRLSFGLAYACLPQTDAHENRMHRQGRMHGGSGRSSGSPSSSPVAFPHVCWLKFSCSGLVDRFVGLTAAGAAPDCPRRLSAKSPASRFSRFRGRGAGRLNQNGILGRAAYAGKLLTFFPDHIRPMQLTQCKRRATCRQAGYCPVPSDVRTTDAHHFFLFPAFAGEGCDSSEIAMR